MATNDTNALCPRIDLRPDTEVPCNANQSEGREQTFNLRKASSHAHIILTEKYDTEVSYVSFFEDIVLDFHVNSF